MKYIPLTQGYEAIVDDEFYDVLNLHKWCFNTGYARRQGARHGKQRDKVIRMHREVIKLSGAVLLDTDKVDHKNFNRLDNRLENLRICTFLDNSYNRRARTKSGYKGVRKSDSKWEAVIHKDGQRYYLGLHLTPEEAAQAYNIKAIELFGEFAWLNPL